MEWSDENVMAEWVDGKVIIINGAENLMLKESDVAARVAAGQKITFEEFLTLNDERTMSEWVDGEVIFMSPASLRHQEIGSLLEVVLRIFIELHQLGTLLRAPFVMRTAESAHRREPDLLFVTHSRAHLIKDTYLDGAADLVVEIVSPESIGRDRGEKFVEYERAGVKEYWLIDPDRESAEFYELDDNGRYRTAVIGDDGIYMSKVVPGFRLRVAWLWQSPPPTLDALRELKLIP